MEKNIQHRKFDKIIFVCKNIFSCEFFFFSPANEFYFILFYFILSVPNLDANELIIFFLLKTEFKNELNGDYGIFQFCMHRETSNKAEFPTFARTRPSDTQISKSVASVLLAFNWTKVK